MEESYSVAVPAEKKFSIWKISYFIIGIFAFILPFFILPVDMPFQMGKGLLFVIAVILALVFYIVSVIKEAKLEVPANLLFLSALVIPLVFLLSAIVNGFNQLGVLGYSFELGTVSSIVIAFIFLFLVSALFQKKENIFLSILGFFISALVVSLFQLVRLFAGADFLSLGILTMPSSNLIGNWNELGFFFGAVAIMTTITLEMVTLTRVFKTIAIILFVFSIFFLLLVNSTMAWVVTAVFCLIFFIYLVSFDKLTVGRTPLQASEVAEQNQNQNQNSKARKVSLYALLLVIIAIVAIVSRGGIGQWMTEKFGISDIEVRPSWVSTIEVSKMTLEKSPLLGVGPSEFSKEWLLYKPLDVNSTVFWNIDFVHGIGLIPTFVVTTGALGILAWAFFFLMLVLVGIRAIFFSVGDPFSRFLIISSFLVSLYLWVVAVIYVPNVTIFVLAYFFTGLFIASLLRESLIRKKVFSLHHPKISFISVLVLIVVLIGAISIGYLIVQKTLSFVYFQKGVNIANQGQNLDEAENFLSRAASLGGYDIYHRALSELHTLRLSNILSQQNVADPEAAVAEAQQVLTSSITSAQTAVNIDSTNYQNWVTLGNIYSNLVSPPFSVPGAYESAKEAYEKALSFNPHNPFIYLSLGRLEVANNNLEAAKKFTEKSIEKKPNYPDAHFLVAQIEVTQGNLTRAIPALETTLILSPNNPGLLFQLGLMKYSGRDFKGAAEAFLAAVTSVPDYANAKYFLGLSLYQLGDTETAIKAFEQVALTNPDNQEIQLILANLRSGKQPFFGVEPPLDNRPEKREELPITETE
ncbi:MAG: hypothetical protein A3B14_01430 [Candidatus Zambryskibacteria bacterium RIFCSPLOWO2_01_FULL_45_21]|uniref:Uncharacterized protein n=1 Tax=Candidatus Zambryskibacteria bacterium RIFCSPLOWO2_01_FULL_45_21 TaxID=1802761 RepID=A0A1G2U711_9BACT|nr:MAG: hypothetical protein A3B14_01430 [Candidatus Zambryskibacteria bacterium RIFCSPLOWO2_01_FULL_45_21]